MQMKSPFTVKTSVVTLIALTAFLAIFFSGHRLKAEISHYVAPPNIPFHAKPATATATATQEVVRPLSDTITGNKVATIVETRPLPNLVPLILHFASVLGPEWPIVIFTTAGVSEKLKEAQMSAPFAKLVHNNRIHIATLPPDVVFSNSVAVSTFLTTAWVWEQLAPADHVLLFQTDSILCSNSEKKMEDYLEYDFIGAPLEGTGWGQGFNGGLSLRNRNLILEVIQQANFTAELTHNRTLIAADENAPVIPCAVEDQWYHKKLIAMQQAGKPVKLPTTDVAKGFTVQILWDDRPLGYHQVEIWQKDKLGHIDTWCPEWRLIKEAMPFDPAPA
ncbi:hypothetical protein BJ875DRAFT_49911 [Amylocarpus encephaloides]|uniref:DUF5672 domain-containing protein n=1 Tax=Amylocarpus encephaloides TaxID=45428 RepID=A0A9P7YGM7_9HELO|nr:hypothetical protein BJ875DRAFT_49911 [Amylocarpus encephaloides]